jgi:AcrR family transcriptional regulator
MGTSERRRREFAKLKTKILNAARMLFVERGYDAVTMRAVAKKIEYSPTAIYLHFKDKESLIQELCTQDFLSLAKGFQRIARVSDPVERLRRIGRAYSEFGLQHPNHYRLMFMTPHPPFDPSEKDVEKGNPEQDGYAFLKYTIADCVRERRFRAGMTDVELIAQTHWAGIHGVISLEIAKCNDDWVDWRSVKKRIELMIDVLIRGLEKS